MTANTPYLKRWPGERVDQLAGAACVGKWQLFDSTDPYDHMEARELCLACPVLLACAHRLEQVQRDSHSLGMPQGTWAAHFYGYKGTQRKAS